MSACRETNTWPTGKPGAYRIQRSRVCFDQVSWRNAVRTEGSHIPLYLAAIKVLRPNALRPIRVLAVAPRNVSQAIGCTISIGVVPVPRGVASIRTAKLQRLEASTRVGSASAKPTARQGSNAECNAPSQCCQKLSLKILADQLRLSPTWGGALSIHQSLSWNNTRQRPHNGLAGAGRRRKSALR
jgi:hypothetical protein